QQEAGIRIEPPISEPVARVAAPEASAAPDPPDDPPGVNSGFQGLRVIPQRRDQVYPAQENSGVAVRAWTMPPARRIRAFTSEVWSATSSFMISEPPEVGIPLIALSSLTATGKPSSARVRAPLAYFASALRASSIARSKWVKVRLLTLPCTAPARPITAPSSTTGDRDLARNRLSASCAGR